MRALALVLLIACSAAPADITQPELDAAIDAPADTSQPSRATPPVAHDAGTDPNGWSTTGVGVVHSSPRPMSRP